LVVPAQVLAALPAKSHAPGIPREPRMFIRGFTERDGARAGDEGLKIAFDPPGVDENMTVRAGEADEMVGAGDQASARAALESFCPVSADSAQREGRGHGLPLSSSNAGIRLLRNFIFGQQPYKDTLKSQCREATGHFLKYRSSRAGLFYGLSMGEFCPLPLFPSTSLGARGFPHR
jgi:hypothetical protein